MTTIISPRLVELVGVRHVAQRNLQGWEHQSQGRITHIGLDSGRQRTMGMYVGALPFRSMLVVQLQPAQRSNSTSRLRTGQYTRPSSMRCSSALARNMPPACLTGRPPLCARSTPRRGVAVGWSQHRRAHFIGCSPGKVQLARTTEDAKGEQRCGKIAVRPCGVKPRRHENYAHFQIFRNGQLNCCGTSNRIGLIAECVGEHADAASSRRRSAQTVCLMACRAPRRGFR